MRGGSLGRRPSAGQRQSVPETEVVTGDYAMVLEFGARRGGKMSGRIYLCLRDDAKSNLAGTFVAAIK